MGVKLGDAWVFIRGDPSPLKKDLGGSERFTRGWVNRLGTSVNKWLGGALQTGLKVATAGVIGLGAAFAAATMQAAGAEGISDSFYAMADGAKLAELRTASMGRVLDVDLMKAYNQATLAVSQSFADDLPDAMQYMGKIADATGQDVGYLLSSYQTGIAKLSPMILDNLGIQVDLAKANQDYAVANGLAVDSLTKEQQQMALNAQVISMLEEKTSGMADTSGNAKVKLDQLRVMFGNLFAQLGAVGLPILTAIATPLVELAMQHLPTIEEALGKFTEAISIFLEGISAGADPIAALKVALFEAFGPAGLEVATNIQAIVTSIGDFIGKIQAFVAEHGPAIMGVIAAIGTVLAGAGIVAAVTAIGTAIASLFSPIGLVVAAAAALGLAWGENWLGIQTITSTVITAISDLWTGTLKPALDAVWNFLSVDMMPIWESLAELLNTTVTLALTALQGVWENVLVPAMEAVVVFLEDTLGPAFTWLQENVIDPVKGSFDGLAGTIQSVADWIASLTEKLNGVDLPDWMTPGSPTPWELGLRGVSDALREIENSSLPNLNMSLSRTADQAQRMTTATGAMSGGVIAAAAGQFNDRRISVEQHNTVADRIDLNEMLYRLLTMLQSLQGGSRVRI